MTTFTLTPAFIWWNLERSNCTLNSLLLLTSHFNRYAAFIAGNFIRELLTIRSRVCGCLLLSSCLPVIGCCPCTFTVKLIVLHHFSYQRLHSCLYCILHYLYLMPTWLKTALSLRLCLVTAHQAPLNLWNHAAICECCIHVAWTDWTFAVALPWSQHYKHCPGYYIIIIVL